MVTPTAGATFRGDIAAGLIVRSQVHTAALVGADPERVHFTSGSTEAIDLAFAHAVSARRNKAGPLRVAVSAVEHRAVLDAVARFTSSGELSVRWIPVDERARLDIGVVEEICRNGVNLLCVMAANNEVGTIYPSERLATLAHDTGASYPNRRHSSCR